MSVSLTRHSKGNCALKYFSHVGLQRCLIQIREGGREITKRNGVFVLKRPTLRIFCNYSFCWETCQRKRETNSMCENEGESLDSDRNRACLCVWLTLTALFSSSTVSLSLGSRTILLDGSDTRHLSVKDINQIQYWCRCWFSLLPSSKMTLKYHLYNIKVCHWKSSYKNIQSWHD